MYKKAAPLSFTLNDFSMGMDWTSPPGNVGDKWLVNAKNINLTGLKAPEKRRGCEKLYPDPYEKLVGCNYGPIMSLYEYKAPDGNNYLLTACGDAVGYYDGAEWIDLKTSLTAGLRYSFAVTNGYCFITNGTDDMFKLKNTTVYSTVGIDAPTVAPTVVLEDVEYESKTEDHSGNSGSYIKLRDANVRTALAQTFQVSQEFILTSVTLRLKKNGSPSGDTWLVIYEDDNGQPGNDIGVDSETIACSSIGGTYAEHIYTFTDQVSLQGNKTYWIALFGDYTINGSNNIQVTKSTGSTYALGYSYRTGGTVWKMVGADFYFKLAYDVPELVSGRYKWVYAYKTDSGLISDYSPPSDPYLSRSQTATVTCACSTSDEVEKIILFRTFDMGDEDSNIFYKVTEVDNDPGEVSVEISDSLSDNELTIQAETNNTAPPLAKYILAYKDRMIYANCPDEEDGHSLFMISKVGSPEAVPSSNYHYFDRDDGNEITGIAMLPDYLIVFKKNKIAAMTSDFSEWQIISQGIGCIAPWAIVVLTDKIVFISEEGVKCTDGRNVFDIGKRMLAMSRAGYWNEAMADEYTGVYYPEKKQFHLNLYNATFSHLDLVGHWLASLYMEITTDSSQEDIYVGWTYHQYEYQTFRTLGTYTDSNGITRIVAGTNDGYVYLLDSGDEDDENPINMIIETGWHSLGTPENLTKTMRGINIVYSSRECDDEDIRLYGDVGFVRNTNYITLTGGGIEYDDLYPYQTSLYNGFGGMVSENLNFDETACGKMFSFRIVDNGKSNGFMLFSISPFFRVEGIR